MLTFTTEWKGMVVLMKHYEKWSEDGSSEKANRPLGAPLVTLRERIKKT